MTITLNQTAQLPYTASRYYQHPGHSNGDSKKFTLLCKLPSTFCGCLLESSSCTDNLAGANFTFQCKVLSTFCSQQKNAESSNYLFGNLCTLNQLHKCAQMSKSSIYERAISIHFNTKNTHMKNSVTCAQAKKCTSMHK